MLLNALQKRSMDEKVAMVLRFSFQSLPGGAKRGLSNQSVQDPFSERLSLACSVALPLVGASFFSLPRSSFPLAVSGTGGAEAEDSSDSFDMTVRSAGEFNGVVSRSFQGVRKVRISLGRAMETDGASVVPVNQNVTKKIGL